MIIYYNFAVNDYIFHHTIKHEVMRTDEEMKWKTISSEYIIRRPWLTARCEKVMLPDGRIHDEYYVLHYPAWVNVIAETDDGSIILERQYRHACQCVSTEICAGVVEEGETPLEAAKRELQEETGYEGREWEELMTIAPNPSTMDNLCHCFVARGVKPTAERHLDANEDLEVFLRTKDEVRDMLQRGVFIQAMMVAPLWKFFSGE